ncbi:MAG: hypothetical protein IT165_05150 [Bryobacterales bacterium]|nr:hypothetical protein [Bryobacterales bacterium]
MKDWKQIAAAQGLVLPQAQLESHVALMAQLEDILENLKTKLAVDTEPATVFQPAPWSDGDAK